jgi:hypothetical protein
MQPGESLPMGPHCAPLLYLRRINRRSSRRVSRCSELEVERAAGGFREGPTSAFRILTRLIVWNMKIQCRWHSSQPTKALI